MPGLIMLTIIGASVNTVILAFGDRAKCNQINMYYSRKSSPHGVLRCTYVTVVLDIYEHLLYMRASYKRLGVD